MNEHVTLVHPDARDPTARAISSGFPVDLLSQAAGRLRVLALLYAFVFFMAGIFPALLFPADRARFLGSFAQWGPSVLGIGVALLVAAVIRSARLLPPTAMNLGLVFPYLLVVGMAYVGARVVCYLGTEVKRARELGSYRLEEKLGEGGMGEVWRARHRMLARPAAIKVIRPSFARDGRGGVSEEAVRRFEREAQVIARLRSPHTVEL